MPCIRGPCGSITHVIVVVDTQSNKSHDDNPAIGTGYVQTSESVCYSSRSTVHFDFPAHAFANVLGAYAICSIYVHTTDMDIYRRDVYDDVGGRKILDYLSHKGSESLVGSVLDDNR